MSTVIDQPQATAPPEPPEAGPEPAPRPSRPELLGGVGALLFWLVLCTLTVSAEHWAWWPLVPVAAGALTVVIGASTRRSQTRKTPRRRGSSRWS